ncbi:MAG: tyrosine-type recombinase/integrase [Candidatus Brocadiales bacterium]|nr:tyrosine-type recombinase/integrase [Candidatus Brocadiales bacterium]
MLYSTDEAMRMELTIHPHMLRHSCGFKLSNDEQASQSIQYYLGHKNIQNTMTYTQVSTSRFKGFWRINVQIGGG